MSENIKNATNLIDQGHVRVGAEMIKDPAFLVSRTLEDFVTWVDSSAIRQHVLEYNNIVSWNWYNVGPIECFNVFFCVFLERRFRFVRVFISCYLNKYCKLMTKDYLELQRFEFFKAEEQSKNWGRSLVTKLKSFKRVRTDCKCDTTYSYSSSLDAIYTRK